MMSQTFDWKGYRADIKSLDGPIDLDTLPKIKIDYRGLIKLAQSKGIQVAELSDKDKDPYIQGGTKHLKQVRGW